jgi:hypothetical protein
LFAYGFIADIVNSRYQYSIASISSFLGMVVNKYIGGPLINVTVTAVRDRLGAQSQAIKGLAETVNDPLKNAPVGGQRGGALPCDVPGFEWLNSEIAPQSIVMSMTILWFILIQAWDNGESSQTIALGVTTAIVFILQWLVMQRYGCLTSYRYTVYSPLIALVMAITFAGSSYGIQKVMRGGSTSSSGGMSGTIRPVFSGGVNGTFVCPSGTGLSPDGSECLPLPGFGGGGEEKVSVGGKNDQSSPVNDQDQFVCEAYKDGELVTSTIVD